MFVESINRTYIVQTYTSEVTSDAILKWWLCVYVYEVWMWILFLYCWSKLPCLHNYLTYDTMGGSGMQLPWVICLVICAFNESLWTILHFDSVALIRELLFVSVYVYDSLSWWMLVFDRYSYWYYASLVLLSTDRVNQHTPTCWLIIAISC